MLSYSAMLYEIGTRTRKHRVLGKVALEFAMNEILLLHLWAGTWQAGV